MKFWNSSLSSLWSLLGLVRTKLFGNSRLLDLWCLLGLPRLKFWNSSLSSLWSFVGPTTDETILELQIVRLGVFAGSATDEMSEPQFVKLLVFAGLVRTKFWNSRM